MIERIPFGRTGHTSSRVIFGAAALARLSQEKADLLLPLLLRHGVNHLDTAPRYGDSELRLAPWLARHRDDFFLATKTLDRTRDGARRSIEQSLERLGVEQIDLLQLHHLVDEEQWRTALGPGGALEAAIEARDQGLVRFLGVTGHGTRVAERHLQSLERFPFDSVLLPYNFSMLQDARYAAEVERLLERCEQLGVAVQTIKSVARRRWQDEAGPRYSWYEPLRDGAALQASVRWVLSRPGIFLNTSSDATLLEPALRAADPACPEASEPVSSATDMAALAARFQVEPLFVRGVSEEV